MNDQSSIQIGKKKFIIVKFPGIVKNEEKAINMLGGIDSIQNVIFILLKLVYIKKNRTN